MTCPRFICFIIGFIISAIGEVSGQTVQTVQTKPEPEVQVDLGSGAFLSTTALPFDVAFKIKAPITPEIREVDFQYRIRPDDYRPWMRFPSAKKGEWSNAVSWKNVDSPPSDNMFRLDVGPIHPDVHYEYHFDIYKTITLSDDQKKALTIQVSDLLVNFLKDPSKITNSSFDDLNASLEGQIKLATNKLVVKFRKPDGSDFHFNLLRDPLRSVTMQLQKAYRDQEKASTNLKSQADFFSSADYKGLEAVVTGIVAANLNDRGKTALGQVVAPDAAGLNTLKVSDVITMLKAHPDLCAEILRGEKKLNGAAVVATAPPQDGPSVNLLLAFFQTLAVGNVQGTDNNDIFAGKKTMLNNTVAELELAVKNQSLLTAAIASQGAVNLPDVLAGLQIKESYDFYDESVSDAVSQNTPYIGLDFGFASLPTYGQIFFYEGANFYFVPVNKDAPLATFHGFFNSMSKRLSVHFGLTQGLISAQDPRYSPLIANVGSVLIGAGIRINRLIRLNAGEMFFWESNLNPLITQKVLMHKFAISMTCDVNVAKALGSIGTKLGL